MSGFSHEDRAREPINRTAFNILVENLIIFIMCRKPPMLPYGSLSKNLFPRDLIAGLIHYLQLINFRMVTIPRNKEVSNRILNVAGFSSTGASSPGVLQYMKPYVLAVGVLFIKI